VIEIIRDLRNHLLNEFLNEERINHFFKEYYQIAPLSKVRMEFLKKDLRELQKSSLNLIHYSGLIRQIKETNSARLTSGMDALFYNELEDVFRKYIF